jgi:hypothetical protein
MDPINLILEAILTDETPNTPAEFTEDQIGYTRDHLMSLLEERLADRPDAAAMINNYLDAPDIWEAQVIEGLMREGIHEDKEIIEVAREVLQYAQPLDPDNARAENPEAQELPATLPGVLPDEYEPE